MMLINWAIHTRSLWQLQSIFEKRPSFKRKKTYVLKKVGFEKVCFGFGLYASFTRGFFIILISLSSEKWFLMRIDKRFFQCIFSDFSFYTKRKKETLHLTCNLHNSFTYYRIQMSIWIKRHQKYICSDESIHLLPFTVHLIGGCYRVVTPQIRYVSLICELISLTK